MVERYASGTSLTRTAKEEHLDRLEGMLAADFPDEFYVAMKKLSVKELKELHKWIADKIAEVYELHKKK